MEYKIEVFEIISEINDFLESDEKNKWITNECFHIYVRKSKRCVNKKFYDFFDIAHIEIYPNNEGIFSYFLNKIENTFMVNIYVESILTKRFKNYLIEKKKFEPYETEGYESVYKLKYK